MKKLLLAQDISNMTRWHLVTVYKKAASGEIPGVVRLGKSLRLDEAAIDAWLKGAKQDQAVAAAEIAR